MERTVRIAVPTMFRARGSVHVNDKNGTPFYVFDKPGEYTFTLPRGTYKLDGGTLLGRMPRRKGHEIPRALRFPLPRKVRLIFATNPRKAVISLPDGVIICDPSLRSLPSFCLVYILFHEIGHYFYEGEEDCDRFAAEEMYRRGFNPSQVMQATELTLGDPARRSCNFHTARNLRP